MSQRPNLRIGCDLTVLSLLVLAVVGWGLYQHPSVNWRMQVFQAEVQDFLFPRPDTLPTPIIATRVTPTLPLLAPASTPDPTSSTVTTSPTIAPSPIPALPSRATLTGFEHQYQTFNNCGPATLTTALSYYGGPERQAEAAAFLKPDGKDKNVSPDEMSAYIHRVGLEATVRVGGSLGDLKVLIANGFPVIVEKGFEPDEDLGWMGHYLLLSGYDDTKGVFMTQDSYLGPDQPMPYAELDKYWRQFNRLFIAPYLVSESAKVESLIGPEDFSTMRQSALATAQIETASDPNDAFAWLNVGTNLTALGRYEEAATAYDQARLAGLPWRMLWYQFDPYEAYYHVGRYEDVLTLADATLERTDNLEESHYWRGMALAAQGNADEARREFGIALGYNPNFEPARVALGN